MAEEDVQKVGAILVYSEQLGRFDFGPDHPYKPERGAKTHELCRRYGVIHYPWITLLDPEPLNPDILGLFHEPDYIRLLQRASQGEVSLEMLERGLGTPDNPILKHVYDWSLTAAGGTLQAMHRLQSGDALIGFNPFGGFHHGMPDHAEGFCYLNDIALTLRDALAKSPGLKIAYIDLDAHHGNGVQEAFFKDPRVLCVSLHETGRTLYPWSGFETEIGEGEGRGFNVNIPLEPGTDDQVYTLVFDAVVPPLVKAFSPDVLVAVIGADTLISDPLTHLRLTNNGYQQVIKKLKTLCSKILALGGGGYDLYRTARCWTLGWAILNRLKPQDEFAGLVGGMMFGPEMEVGSLYDHPYQSDREVKHRALLEAKRVITHIQRTVFPIHGIDGP